MVSSRSAYFEKSSKKKHKGRVPREKHTLRDKRPKGGDKYESLPE